MTTRLRPISTLALATALAAQSVGPAAAQQDGIDAADQSTLTRRMETVLARDGAEMGGDVEAVLDYVRTHVRPEPYEGVLKGAAATLLTGSGNGADQALLAASLLDASDVAPDHRFASCELEAAVVSGLTGEAATGPGSLLLDHAGEIAAAIDDPDLRAEFLSAAEAFGALDAAGAASTELLAGELGFAGWMPAMTVPTESSTHVWLQVADGEQWSDADPLTASGTAPCEAVFTYDTLPPSLRHRVRISVVAETQDASGLSEDVVLDHEVAVEELATSRIAFAFAEPNDMRPAQRSPAAAWDYTPMLRIDNHSIEGTAISLPPIQGTTGSLFEDAAGGLGGLGGGGSDGGGALSGLAGDGKASADDEAAVTAMWLEFELTPPSGEAVTVRSEIFDRIGPAARGGQVDIEPTPLEVVAHEYVEMLPMWQIGLLVGPVANAAGAPTGEGILFQSFDGLSGQLDAMLRTFPGVRSRSGTRDSGPSIVLAGLDMTPDDEGGVTTQLVLDAAHVPGYPPSDALDAARDARSVITAEAAMLSMLAESAAPLADVGSVFEAARTSGIPMTRLEPGDPIDVGGLSEQAQARIEARLDGGYSLLTPSQAPSIGGLSQTAWFVIDPATGVVRDEHESGRHQMGEEAPQQGNALARTETTRKTTCAASKGWFLAIALFLSVLAGPDPVDAAVESVRRTEEVQRVIEVNRDAACSIAGTPG